MFPDVGSVVNIPLFTLDCVCITGPPPTTPVLVLGLWAVCVSSVTARIGGRNISVLGAAIFSVTRKLTVRTTSQNRFYYLCCPVREMSNSTWTSEVDSIINLIIFLAINDISQILGFF